MSLENKVVIVTGASSGIGKATAILFAENGANVIVADLNEENGKAVVNDINNSGQSATFIKLDVSKVSEVENLIDTVYEKFGTIDVLVNNAGIGNKVLAKTADHTLEDWDNVVAVNQSGVFYCMKYALKKMIAQGHGNIVNVASLAGLKASGKNIAYSGSKFAVVGMTKSAALEYGHKNIRVNAVCPGYTESALLNQLIGAAPQMKEKLLQFIPMRRFGKANEIAEAILWLGSDKSSFVTGQTITLDGGLSL